MEKSEDQVPDGARRSFFAWLIMASAGLIGISLAVPLSGYVVSPALKRREKSWVDAGPVGDLPVGAPAQRDVVMTLADGYREIAAVKDGFCSPGGRGTFRPRGPPCSPGPRPSRPGERSRR